MPDSKQQLGIELNLTLNGTFESLIKQIEERFSKLNVSGAVKKVEALEKAITDTGKAGLTFSNFTNSQWKLLEAGAQRAGISISKVGVNIADVNKIIATLSNTSREWGYVTTDASGKAVSGVKAATAAFKALAEAEEKARQVNAAYAQKAAQDGVSSKQVSMTTDAAYKQRGAQIDAERKIEAERIRLYADKERAEKNATAANINASNAAQKAHELATEEKARQINAAYAQRDIQDGVSPKQVSTTTDLAYKQRSNQLAVESKISAEKARMRLADEDDEKRHINRLSELRFKEDAIIASREASYKRMEDARLRESGSQVMRDYSRMGMSPVNGGYARSSAVNYAKNNSMDSMQIEATKYNASLDRTKTSYNELLPKIQEYDNWLRGLNKQGLALWGNQIVSMKEYNQHLNKTNSIFDMFGTSLGKVAKHLVEFYGIRGVIFAVSDFLKNSISGLVEFNQGLYDTAAISNASEKSMLKIGDAAKLIARNSKESLPEIMKMFNLLSQSGVDAEAVPKVGQAISMFSTGTGSSYENAVRVTTTAMNVWKVEAKDVMQVMNTLTAGLNASKLEVQDLSTVFNYLAATAAQAGFSLEETTAVVASLSQAGIKASTIGTSVQQLLTVLMSPTPKVRKMLDDYGIGIDEVNPRLHKFSEIVARLKGADIPLERLLGGFGTRTGGRALIAAINLGSDYFEMMEKNVTGTSAALTAYEKSMEGPLARMNILKQETVQFIDILGGGLHGAFVSVIDSLTTFVRGMQTSEAQFTVLAGAALVAVPAIVKVTEALIAFGTANPELLAIRLAITAIVSAVGGLVYAFGSLNEAKVNDITKEFKALVKESSDAQRVFTAVSQIYADAAQAKQLDAKLSNTAREKLEALKEAYPNHIKNIKLETATYRELSKVMQGINDDNDNRTKRMIQQYNTLQDRVKTLKAVPSGLTRSTYAERENSLTEQISYYKKNGQPDQAALLEGQLVKLQEQFKQDYHGVFDQLSTMELQIESSSVPTNDGTNHRKFVPTVKIDPRKGNEAPPEEDKEDKNKDKRDKRTSEAIINHKIAMEKLRVEEEKTNLEQAKLELKNDKDLAEYKLKAKAAIDREYNLKLEEAILRENKTAAADVGGKLLYDENGNIKSIQAGDGYTQNEVNEASKRASERLTKEKANLALKKKEDLTKVDQTKAPEDKLILNSEFIEKQINRRITLENEDYAIRQKLTENADEQRRVEIEHNNNLVAMYKDKKDAYVEDIARAETFLYNTKETGDALAAHIQRYEETKEKLEDINRLIATTKSEISELSNNNFWPNFDRGISTSLKNIGDFKTQTQNLGSTITTTFVDGMTNAIDSAISKIEEMKFSWKDFASSLVNVIKTISDELQKYIVKLMVVSAVEKIVGIFGPGSSDTVDVQGPSGTISNTASVVSFDNAGGLIKKFADGGQVPLNMGTPGMDSVRAMLTPGEFVVKKSVVDSIGAGRLQDLNDGKIQKFASGGLVSAGASGGSSKDDTLGNLVIINVADASSIPPSSPNEQQIVNIVSFAAQNNSTFKYTLKRAVQ